MESVLSALLISTIAGLSTLLGGYLGIIKKKPNPKTMSFLMAFSAGVMVYLSFMEMYVQSIKVINSLFALIFLAVGILIAFIIDMFLPEDENVHDHLYDKNNNSIVIVDKGKLSQNNNHCTELFCTDKPKMMKLGLISVIALFIHNFPEGLITFSASLVNFNLGIKVALAIMLHNIPEGICVAVPIYKSTKNRKRAMFYTAIAGLAEPLGAICAWLILQPFLNEQILMGLFALTAGIMIYIAVDVLLPTAKSMEHKHTSIIGFTMGFIFIGLSIILIS